MLVGKIAYDNASQMSLVIPWMALYTDNAF